MILKNSFTITGKVAAEARRLGVTVRNRFWWETLQGPLYRWRRRNKPHALLPARPVDTIWQHITVTRPSGDFAADVRAVERIGMARFGAGVSYNWLVDMATGEVAIGQPLDARGAHTLMRVFRPGFSRDQNLVSLAIACIGMPPDGGYKGTALSPAARLSISRLLAAHVLAGAATDHFDYVGHYFADPKKSCPAGVVRSAMHDIKLEALEIVARERAKN